MENKKIKKSLIIFLMTAQIFAFFSLFLSSAAPEIFKSDTVFAANKSANKEDKIIKPKTIPCDKSLPIPCISEKTQETSEGVRKHVVENFGVRFLKGFMGMVGVTSVVFIIVGGLQMHLAMGNDETIKKARTTIMWAIGGLLIAILSVAIVNIISKLEFQ